MPAARRVALLVETSKAFGRGLLLGIGRYAQLHARWSLFVEERGLEAPIPAWIARSRFDGIILRTQAPAGIGRILRLGVPMVCVGEDEDSSSPRVSSDYAQSAQLAAAHLLERNFPHFGYVGIRGFAWSDARREAFVAELERAGSGCHVLEPSRRSRRSPRWDRVRDRVSAWLGRLPKPVGVMCCSDASARTVLEVCRELDLTVPEEVGVVGVDNDELLCELSEPPLTSVALDAGRIGAEAAAMLDRLMRGEAVVSPVVVPPRGIVTRRSTDTQAIADRDVAIALGFIRRFACDGISVDDVVRRVPLSRRTLERRFRAHVGHAPLAEMQRARLRRLKDLLVETELKLDAVAALCGFASTSYMVSQFRRLVGVTPGEFRRRRILER